MKTSSPLRLAVALMLALPACQWLAGIDDRKAAGPPDGGGGLGDTDVPAGSGGAAGVDGGGIPSGGSEGRDSGAGGVIGFDGGSVTGGKTGTPDASTSGGTTAVGGRASTGGISGAGGLVGKGGAVGTGGVVGSGGAMSRGGTIGGGGNSVPGGSGGNTGTGGGTGGATHPDGAVAGCSGASVFDDFSSTSLDTTTWSTNTSIPLGTPSVVQTGGHVEITNRGYLNSVGPFVPSAGGVRVTGTWTFDPTAAADDFLQVLTRSDGVPQGEFGENQAGIECYARMATSAVGIAAWGTTVSNPTSTGSFLINRGDTLAFEMTDDGSLVTCAFVNLTSGMRGRASATSTFAPTSNRITLHNREFEGETRRSFLDDLAIESGFVNRPIHHYLFEETSGATAYDLPGTTDGTLGAGASRVDAIRGSGVSFAGTSDGFVDLGTVGSALGTADFTIAFWFKVPDTTHLMDLLGDRVNLDFGNFAQIRMNAAGSIGFEVCQDVSGSNYQAVDSAPGYDDSKWHHLAVRRQGMTLALFVDGALTVANTRTTGTRTDLSNGAPLRLGSSAIAPDFDGRTTGTFDDLRIYGTALTDCDVALIASQP